MRTFRTIAFGILFAAFFTVSAMAQAAGPGRTYVINPFIFADEKAGITRYVGGLKQLNTEFMPVQNELAALAAKIEGIGKELKVLQEQAAGGKVPVDQSAARAKADEYERLQRELKFKQEDAKAKYDKRETVVMGPIRQEIGAALQEFGKKNGYWMIFDASKLDEIGAFLMIDETADVTKPFIVFFNARPATATVPK
jgi:Skp family chaperone for outer membrane proteins